MSVPPESDGARHVEPSGQQGVDPDLHTPHRNLRLDPGPHPGQGPLHFTAELDGERIVALDAQVGFGHRGFEKLCEERSWYQIVPWVERLQPDAAPLAAAAYCEAVETLMDLELPPRARIMRVAAGELARIGSHFGRMAALANALAARTPAQYALQARERVRDLLEALTGARSGAGYVRIGGVSRPTSDDFPDHVASELPQLRRGLRETDTLMGRNRLFVKRLSGSGAISREACLSFGVTGPPARAAGWARDLRKEVSNRSYSDLDFDVPVGRCGDNLDRQLVLVEEVRQSLRILEQCFERLDATAPGPLACQDPTVSWPARGGAPSSDEARSTHERSVREGPQVPVGEVEHAVESSNGELGFHLVSDGSPCPSRVRCRAPSFFHAQALESTMRGQPLADLAPTVALLGIASGECDR